MDAYRFVPPLLLIVPAMLLLAAACGDDDEAPPSTQGPSAVSSTPAATATLTSILTPTVTLDASISVVFVRAPEEIFHNFGELWLNTLDGSAPVRVSPTGVNAALANIGRNEGGGTVLYYIAETSKSTREIWIYDLESHVSTSIFTYEANPESFWASVSPNGQYIAFISNRGLEFHDRMTGETRILFASGDQGACQAGDIRECQGYLAPQWSADNLLILATHGVYEGGWVDLVDPFTEPPTTYIEDSREVPSSGRWSADGTAICAQGIYGGPSSLYLFEAPEWQTRRLTSEFEDWTQNPEGRWVNDCGWVGDSEIAFVTAVQAPMNTSELSLVDIGSGETELVGTFLAGTCCSGRVTIVEGRRMLLVQFVGSPNDPNYHGWAQPQLVDIESGQSTPFLQPGDLIVAAFIR